MKKMTKDFSRLGVETLEDRVTPSTVSVFGGGNVVAVVPPSHDFNILVVGAKRASDTPGPHGTAFALLSRSRVPVLCVPPEPAPKQCCSESCSCSAAK